MNTIKAQPGLWSIRCYRWLMWLYPSSFVSELGDSVEQAFRDMLRDAFQKRGYLGIATLWFRIIPDFLFSAFELLTSTTGDYLKWYFRLRWVLACALGLGAGTNASGQVHAVGSAKAASERAQPYNILFLLVDQERLFRPGELPAGYRLPAHERLMKRGTTFVNHRICPCVCTPSRSVLYTGQHIQHTRMFDNTNFPWTESMSTEIPTLGDMMRDAGYYTAYKGK